MHPDERNIVLSIQRLHCDVTQVSISIQWLKDCYNPEFFAYGQPTIYGGYVLAQALGFSFKHLFEPITFDNATLALRFISAMASLLNVFVLYKTLLLLFENKMKKNKGLRILVDCSVPILAFSPYFIQFSHFGTTESLLMLLYSVIIYYSLSLNISFKKNQKKIICVLGILTGFSIAVKISSIAFMGLPIVALFFTKQKIKKKLFYSFLLLFISLIVALLFSPQSLLHNQDFLGSMSYETGVGRGLYKAFYTRQFEYSIPILFQTLKVFPYILGMAQFIIFLCGICFLSWKKKSMNLLRIAFFLFFIPTAFLYAKWTRFAAPIFPVMTLFSAIFLIEFVEIFFVHLRPLKKSVVFMMMVCFIVLPGIAYIHIYQAPDVRFQASEWIYKNLPEGVKVLSETANVVDIPIQSNLSTNVKPSYSVISFDFYHLDEDDKLKADLANFMNTADYIFVPSRRLFTNHTCIGPLSWKNRIDTELSYEKNRCERLNQIYPSLNSYYANLFSPNSHFTQIAEFTSYPQVRILGKNIIQFPDEMAEETWTVFDHPVVRVYKRS
jgi:hypothetical protein